VLRWFRRWRASATIDGWSNELDLCRTVIRTLLKEDEAATIHELEAQLSALPGQAWPGREPDTASNAP
jgi:hypothetical protein